MPGQRPRQQPQRLQQLSGTRTPGACSWDVQPIEGAFLAASYITQYATKAEQPNEDQVAAQHANA